jgi:hypothetical protein
MGTWWAVKGLRMNERTNGMDCAERDGPLFVSCTILVSALSRCACACHLSVSGSGGNAVSAACAAAAAAAAVAAVNGGTTGVPVLILAVQPTSPLF